MYYKCTECQNEQTEKIKCNICGEQLYMVYEYPRDILENMLRKENK
jgi:hypothetical protein